MACKRTNFERKFPPSGPARLLCGLMIVGGLSLIGCATPDYLLPGGYSSTFHKAQLQGNRIKGGDLNDEEPPPLTGQKW